MKKFISSFVDEKESDQNQQFDDQRFAYVYGDGEEAIEDPQAHDDMILSSEVHEDRESSKACDDPVPMIDIGKLGNTYSYSNLQDAGSLPMCKTAETTLFISFSWGDFMVSSSEIKTQLCQKKISMTDGTSKFIWLPTPHLPPEVKEFSRNFQQSLGIDEKKSSQIRTWKVCRVTMNSDVQSHLFKNPKLWLSKPDGAVSTNLDIKNIELILFPLGMGLISLKIRWPLEQESLRLDQFRSWLFAARHLKKTNVVLGWSFTSSESVATVGSPNASTFFKESGRAQEKISLKLFSTIILLLGSSGSKPLHVSTSRFAFHHTCVVCDQKPDPQVLKEYLFYLRRGYGQINLCISDDDDFSDDKLLALRSNRHVGICREGVASISWVLTQSNGPNTGESYYWPQEFQSIYALLFSHVAGERIVLEGLSYLVAKQADKLDVLEPTTGSFSAIKEMRNNLAELALLMTRYMLCMSSDDCGGPSTYSSFFQAVRLNLGIPSIRTELREELQDVLAVVESNYMEERVKRKEEEKQRKKRRDAKAKAVEDLAHEQEGTVQYVVSGAAAIVIPVTVVSGLFGMNNQDLPNVPFLPLIGATFGFCGLLLIFFLVFTYISRRKMQRLLLRDEESFEALEFG